MSDELHATAAARLRGVDQRYTTGRRGLVDALVAAGRPVTAAELVAHRPDMPQSTTYRNLAVLEQAGVVHRVLGSDEFARFELAEDLAGHHHHLVCTGCGQVVDFRLSPTAERAVDRAAAEAARSAGFRAVAHRVDLLGLCDNCARAREAPAPKGGRLT